MCVCVCVCVMVQGKQLCVFNGSDPHFLSPLTGPVFLHATIVVTWILTLRQSVYYIRARNLYANRNTRSSGDDEEDDHNDDDDDDNHSGDAVTLRYIMI